MSVLGIDVGGTFTDFYFVTDGGLRVHKLPSTPDDPARAILAGLRETGWRADEIVHGSTVATNTVLERSGALTALVATRGFRDLLEIGRQARPTVYELEPRRPPPLVPRELCFEAPERLDYRGNVLEALTKAEAERLAAELQTAAPEAVAVCLLFSYVNPRHEAILGEALRRAGLDVSLSCEVLPEAREYERASTTVLNAYVGPRVRRYLQDLEARLAESGAASLAVVQSSGGTLTPGQAARLPAATLLSGPAAGVAGAFAVAREAGFDNVITFDMGGTSTDVCLCPGRIPYTSEWEVSGLPVRLPAVDVHTVGAGGGSIAWMDEGGALRVGPRSAGADPGPAAYGRGGPATTTDANLVLGRLAEGSLLGGRFNVDAGAARAALARLGMASPEEAAAGVVGVANTLMERALRFVSVQRGFDPADFVLVAFGGAGPLHACELAQALRMRRVLVPRYPGVLSALGMTRADPMRDYSLSLASHRQAATDEEWLEKEMRAALARLEERARKELGRPDYLQAAVDLRYEGQGYELTLPWQQEPLPRLLQRFHAEHARRYGHADAGRAIELVTLRLRAGVARPPPQPASLPEGPADPGAALVARRGVSFGALLQTPVYDRERLLAGNLIEGPAVVAQMDSTTLVLPGWRAMVDAAGNLLLEASDRG